VFALGLLGLKTALLELDLKVYDEANYRVRPEVLHESLMQVGQIYDVELSRLLESMLSFNPEERPTFEKIAKSIHETLHYLDHPEEKGISKKVIPPEFYIEKLK